MSSSCPHGTLTTKGAMSKIKLSVDLAFRNCVLISYEGYKHEKVANKQKEELIQQINVGKQILDTWSCKYHVA